MKQVTFDNIGPFIIRQEVLEAIKDMKNSEAEGVDSITVEMLKCLCDRTTEMFVDVCQRIYDTGEWPKDFLESAV